MKKIIITILIFLICNVGYASSNIQVINEGKHYKCIQEIYTVTKDDTLDTITIKFMNKNTYGPREFYEFREGIIENNLQLCNRDVIENEKLVIIYWIKK